MSSSALPPLGNLPSWSRVSKLDKSRYPKPFLRDRLQTLPPTGSAVNNTDHHGDGSNDLQIFDSLNPVEQQRILYYNKSIKFLQQQHADTLQKLHEEIDKLKKENKDLQYKFIMRKKSPVQGKKSTFDTFDSSLLDQKGSDFQSILLQEEVKDLQQALKHAQGRNAMLQQALRSRNKSLKSGKQSGRSKPSSELPDEVPSVSGLGESAESLTSSGKSSVSWDSTYLSSEHTTISLPFGATIDPLVIQESQDVNPRSPSITECEVIIKYLHRLSARQIEENSMLKSDLKDILYSGISGRYSTKSQIASSKSEDSMKLPKVSIRDQIPKQLSATAHCSPTDRVALPALKQTINTNIADRRKRQQAVQKTRSRRETGANF